MKRTSVTHPLRIDALRVSREPGAGTIGLTFCPGKTSKSLHGAPWERDLASDLDMISNWGADLVVTLLEAHEFKTLAVENLPDAIAARFAWVHAPIPDVDVPGDAFERAWAAVTCSIHELLSRGGNVLIHCRGGLGRAGLVAALILIERGRAAGDAIASVRAARPGAIETSAQEAWLKRRAQDTRLKPALHMASLLCGAFGDSIGAEVEFKPLKAIRHACPNGLVGQADQHGLNPVTDDTQMTLFTMEGLIEGLRSGEGPDKAVHRALLRWLMTQGETPQISLGRGAGLILDRRLWRRRAPGMTCLSALCATRELGVSARNDSKGCGTIMRVAPVAFVMPSHDVARVACSTSALTHGHVTGQVAAAAWAMMLAEVGGGSSIEAAADAALAWAETQQGGSETGQALRAALEARRDGRPETVETLGGGWVAEEALAIALYACLACDDLDQGLQCAALHSGDSDSTAAIAGNMLGMLHPEQVLSHRWAKQVQFHEHFDSLTEELAMLMEKEGGAG